MNQQEWQDFLDDAFPDGAIVTQIVDVPEGGDNYKLLVPRLRVLDVEDDEPTIKVFPVGMLTKDVWFRVRKLEPYASGYLIYTPEDKDPNFIVTKNFDEYTAKVLRRERDRLTKVEAQYEQENAG